MRVTRSYKSGTVYLIHFESKLSHAQHYIGYAKSDLFQRMREHRANRGARILAAVNSCGIPWHIVRTWCGTPKLERRLKNRKKAADLCPICSK